MVAEFKQLFITDNDQIRFDGDSVEQGAADELPKKPWPEGTTVENFLSAVRLDGCGALKFKRSAGLAGNQQSADMASTIDFKC